MIRTALLAAVVGTVGFAAGAYARHRVSDRTPVLLVALVAGVVLLRDVVPAVVDG